MEKYPNAKEIVWVQEEPATRACGTGPSSRQHLDNVIGTKRRLLLVSAGRCLAAVGYYAMHNLQQKAVIENAFGPKSGRNSQ